MLANIKFHSAGLICFSFEEWGCPEGVWQRSVGLIDLTTESVSFYWICDEDNFWDGPASEWQACGKAEGSFTSLSEYFMSRANQTRMKNEEERKRAAERA